ncbi:arginine--tRNA ligase [Candidatus Woesearchaeota archaeon]|nr:arginine--tRNA ligase [Candidatus Woesearchaeota archaeon]MCF7901319.1 arginine--tRNA ligase [Candidatus Woesearchaeota archaeon]MCF8013993.1 arginine--tRNA ligase [Candidatus Woesearchaeota archaeon]
MNFKELISKKISDHTNLDECKVFELLEVPPKPELGDFAFPCFLLAKELKKSPAEIATDLTSKIKENFIEKVEAKGPYVNFWIKKEILVKNVLESLEENIVLDKKDKILLESPGPNTNKPLHLGHLRNMLLGVSNKKILNYLGHEVIPVDVVNDRGIHICKSMLAYKLFGNNETPESSGMKGDYFVGKYYVKFAEEVKNNPELEDQAKEMLKLWEEGDEETLDIWKKMRDWCLAGFKESFKNFDVVHEKSYYESETYKAGKEIILNGLENGLFEKDEDGAIIANLEDKGLGKKVLLRADGTSIYITQDIELARQRFEDYNMDRIVYIVGSEQIHHFKVLFEILKMLNFPFADKCHHLAYGMVYLPDGKMKSREGTIVDADNFKSDMVKMAKLEVKERYPDLNDDELNTRADMIASAAVNFFILKYDAHKDFVYDPKQSLSFTGDSGPYIQYTHARICSIQRKANLNPENINYSLLELDSERNLINKLEDFKDIILKSAENYRPSLIANYLLELSQLFNNYYHETQIIIEEKELMNARLFLINKIKYVLNNGLSLLNIKAPEEM